MKKILIIIRLFPILLSIFYIYWNRIYFIIAGIQYGRNLKVYNKLYIEGFGRITIGDDFTFTSGGCINSITRNVRGVFYTVTPNSEINIGDHVGISSSCLWALDKITIGNNVKIGGDCIIIDNDAHPLDYIKRRSSYDKEMGAGSALESVSKEAIHIEDDVWIGARCQVLKGVHIGARSIIAAGSIVTNDIPSDVIAGGNPCRVIRKLC